MCSSLNEKSRPVRWAARSDDDACHVMQGSTTPGYSCGSGPIGVDTNGHATQ